MSKTKKPPKPIEHPINVQITPRLLGAVEAAIGRRLPPGCKVMVIPKPLPLTIADCTNTVPAPR